MEDLEHKKALIETIAHALLFSQGFSLFPLTRIWNMIMIMDSQLLCIYTIN
jgi:hypothetical protein